MIYIAAFLIGLLATNLIFYRYVKQKVRVTINHKDGSQTIRMVRMTDSELKHWRKTGEHAALKGLKPE